MWRIGIECEIQQNLGWGYFINVKYTHVYYIYFDFVHIFHKVWDIGTKYLGPSIHLYWVGGITWRIGTNFSRAVRSRYQFFTVWHLRSVKFAVQHSHGQSDKVSVKSEAGCFGNIEQTFIRPSFLDQPFTWKHTHLDQPFYLFSKATRFYFCHFEVYEPSFH